MLWVSSMMRAVRVMHRLRSSGCFVTPPLAAKRVEIAGSKTPGKVRFAFRPINA
jgi:hypothetical protein